MPQPILMQASWESFRSDVPRQSLGNGAFRLRDWIPNNDAPLRKRGGFLWATTDLSALGSAANMVGVAWAPFATDPHLISIANTGNLFRSTGLDGLTGDSLIGSAIVLPTYRPFWHRDRIIMMQGVNGAANNPRKYYDSGGAVYAIADVGGTPPQARVGWSWGDYVVFANGYVGGTLFPNRIWFSGVANPDAYTPGTSFFDIVELEEIVAGTVLRSFNVVWGYRQAYILLGDTPPPNGNLQKKYLFEQGMMDGRSLVKYKDFAVWANEAGIWKTDGTTLTDLTQKAGISLYWRALVKNFSLKQGWSAAAGLHRGEYWITITNAAGVTLTTVVINLESNTSREQTNIKAAMYAERFSGPGTATVDAHEEIFFAHRALPRIGAGSSTWYPDSTNSADADGTNVLPRLETAYYRLYSFWHRRIIPAPQSQRLRAAYIGYDLRPLAGGAPDLRVDAVYDPVDTAYAVLTPTLAATTKRGRGQVNIRRKALGVAFAIQQEGPSADTRIYSIELDGHALEGGRN